MNTEQILTHLRIDTESVPTAVQQVRMLVEGSPDPLGAARLLFQQLTLPDTEFKFSDANDARLIVAHLVQAAIRLGESYHPDDALLAATRWLAKYKIDNPWAFVKSETSSTTIVTTTQTRDGVSVEVKSDGSLKKGAKQILALALYEKNKHLTNAQLVELFTKELKMSLAGARTYVYNCKKANK
jgi:hypothetical protein